MAEQEIIVVRPQQATIQVVAKQGEPGRNAPDSATLSDVAAAIAAHVAEANPHTQYAIETAVAAAIAQQLQQFQILIADAITQHLQQSNPHPQYELASSIAPSEYQRTFTQADVSIIGLLPVIHSFNTYPSGVAVFDETGTEVTADGWSITNADTIGVDLSSFVPIPGTWTISVTA